LSLQPDGEYLELINLSSKDIDVSGWTIDGAATGGREARFPFGSVVKAHGLLIAAVDLDDSQIGLAGNRIYVDAAWELPNGVEAVQLDFPSGAPSADEDWLKIIIPSGLSPSLILRSGEGIVDQVEYPLSGTGFQSLEKGDPTLIVDSDLDGYDDGWFRSFSCQPTSTSKAFILDESVSASIETERIRLVTSNSSTVSVVTPSVNSSQGFNFKDSMLRCATKAARLFIFDL